MIVFSKNCTTNFGNTITDTKKSINTVIYISTVKVTKQNKNTVKYKNQSNITMCFMGNKIQKDEHKQEQSQK